MSPKLCKRRADPAADRAVQRRWTQVHPACRRGMVMGDHLDQCLVHDSRCPSDMRLPLQRLCHADSHNRRIRMLPKSEHRPSSCAQLEVSVPVSEAVGLNLRSPPIRVGLWPSGVEGTAMPEAPIHKDRHFRPMNTTSARRRVPGKVRPPDSEGQGPEGRHAGRARRAYRAAEWPAFAVELPLTRPQVSSSGRFLCVSSSTWSGSSSPSAHWNSAALREDTHGRPRRETHDN